MNNLEKTLDELALDAGECEQFELVIKLKYAHPFIVNKIQQILEQIEDCKFSQLGELIEKLKEEYK